jgi:PhnB protein
MTVKTTPEGHHSVTAYLIVDGAAAAIEFYKSVFQAKEVFRLPSPDGRVGHAEIIIGDTHVMIADVFPEHGAKGPKTYGGSPISLMLYVTDVDATFENAKSSGAKIIRPVENQFYGDRNGTLEDPFGHTWTISTHIEDVTPDEMKKRMDELMNKK